MKDIDILPKADLLSDHEIDTITAEVTKILSDLSSVRQFISKDIVGENAYANASFLLHLLEEPSAQLLRDDAELDRIHSLSEDYRQMSTEWMRDLLQDADDEELQQARNEAIDTAESLFPNDPMPFLLEQDDKLALLGVIMDTDTKADAILAEPSVSKLLEALDEIDAYIATLYASATHFAEGDLDVEVSNVHFRVTMNVKETILSGILGSNLSNTEKERKIAELQEYENVSIIDGNLQINGITVKTREQARRVASVIHCLPEITEKLKQYSS